MNHLSGIKNSDNIKTVNKCDAGNSLLTEEHSFQTKTQHAAS